MCPGHRDRDLIRLADPADGPHARPMTDARIAIVTGANRGIGQEIARELTARGLQVVPTSRAAQRGYVMLDVEDRASIDALVRAQAKAGIDILVNNAGASFDGFDATIAARTLAVNFFGAMHLTDALLPSMRPEGRVVMVSSGMGKLSQLGPALRARFDDPSLARAALVELLESFVRDVGAGVHARRGWPSNAYSVSKVGLNALVRVLARELAGDPRGILVNSADPGWVRTRMGGPAAPLSVEDGAKTPVYLALLPSGGPTGGFFSRQRPVAF
jgi:NAD(P)-dependent dehydrogenase (short-subunit alcohol dehydrogenase family)